MKKNKTNRLQIKGVQYRLTKINDGEKGCCGCALVKDFRLCRIANKKTLQNCEEVGIWVKVKHRK